LFLHQLVVFGQKNQLVNWQLVSFSVDNISISASFLNIENLSMCILQHQLWEIEIFWIQFK